MVLLLDYILLTSRDVVEIAHANFILIIFGHLGKYAFSLGLEFYIGIAENFQSTKV